MSDTRSGPRRSPMPSADALETAWRDVHNLLAAYEGLGVLRHALDTYRAAQAGYEQGQHQQATLEQELTTLQHRMAEARTQLGQVEQEMAAKRTAAEATLTTQQQELTQAVAQQQAALQAAQAALKTAQQETQQLQTHARQRAYEAGQRERQRWATAAEQARAQVDALTQEIATLTGHRDRLQAELAALAQRIRG